MQILPINNISATPMNSKYNSQLTFGNKETAVSLVSENGMKVLSAGVAAAVGAATVKNTKLPKVSDIIKEGHDILDEISDKASAETSINDLIGIHRKGVTYIKLCERYLSKQYNSKIDFCRHETREAMFEIIGLINTYIKENIAGYFESEDMPHVVDNDNKKHIHYGIFSQEKIDTTEKDISDRLFVLEYAVNNFKKDKETELLYQKFKKEQATLREVKKYSHKVNDFVYRDPLSIIEEYRSLKGSTYPKLYYKNELYNFLFINHFNLLQSIEDSLI